MGFVFVISSHMVQIRKETTNIWEYKIDKNTNIVNFVRQ